MACLDKRWHVVRDFSRAAPGQHSDNGFRAIEPEMRRKLSARSSCGNVAHQGMPDEVRRHTARAIPFLLERKNAEAASESPPHQVCTPRPPGPKLRAHKINVGDVLALQRARQAQMKA